MTKMLGNNIKELRKQKGYTQETFAQELNVVRQTVSKWEKGYSVPDAITLEKIAELLEVPVGDLLSDGEIKAKEKPDLKEVADQLSILNNQYAKEMARRKRNRKIALIVVTVFLSISLIAAVISIIPHDRQEYGVDDGGIVLSYLDRELDEAVSKAIISENETADSSAEFTTESHVVYGMEEKDGTIKVYLFENHTGFGFKDGFFTDVSGGSTPSVLTFKESENGIEDIWFTEFIKERFNYDVRYPFVMSLLHEVGHHKNNDDVVGEVYDFCLAEKERIMYETMATDDEETAKALTWQYFNLPDEIMATAWAVNYARKHPKKIKKKWKKMRSALLDFYEKNNFKDVL